MSTLTKYEEAYADILNERGYLVLGSSHKQSPGSLHDGGKYESSTGHPFYVICETDASDMAVQAFIMEKHGFVVDCYGFEHYYRVNTD